MLVRSGLLDSVFALSGSSYLLASFVAGIFFTSFLTLAPAAVVLYEILHAGAPAAPVIFLGAAGAVIGDFTLLKFLQISLTNDLVSFVRRHTSRRLKRMWRLKWFSLTMAVIGALIIASPLPDEFGLALIGISKIPIQFFIPLSYVMNALGIFIISLIA